MAGPAGGEGAMGAWNSRHPRWPEKYAAHHALAVAAWRGENCKYKTRTHMQIHVSLFGNNLHYVV